MEIPSSMSNEGGFVATGMVESSRLAEPPGRCSKRLLGELLALNVEMIGQLELERLSDAGTAGFLTKMIAQHEKAAALLRSQLASGGNVGRR